VDIQEENEPEASSTDPESKGKFEGHYWRYWRQIKPNEQDPESQQQKKDNSCEIAETKENTESRKEQEAFDTNGQPLVEISEGMRAFINAMVSS